MSPEVTPLQGCGWGPQSAPKTQIFKQAARHQGVWHKGSRGVVSLGWEQWSWSISQSSNIWGPVLRVARPVGTTKPCTQVP